MIRIACRCLAVFALVGAGVAGAKQVDPPVRLGRDGRLEYVVDARGDRIVDFSHAGYRGGGVALPDATARVRVEPGRGQDGVRIQAALDYVAALAPDAQGLRGAVILERGRYEIPGQLLLRASGVVLRGAGSGADGTVLVATGTDRRALIELGTRAARTTGEGVAVVDSYVPVGATKLRLTRAGAISPGQTVIVERPSPLNWIERVGMHEAPGRQPFEWKAGTLNLRTERRVVAVEGDTITLDAPLVVALEAEFGGGRVLPSTPAAVENVGVENLRCESAFDRTHPADEEHAWTAVHLAGLRDAWVANVTGAYFPGSLVYVSADAARVTVQDCVSVEPVSEDGGHRRMTFHTAGQQTLFLRCRAEDARHAFTTGHLAAGPNVFLDCVAERPRNFSGAAGSWACGLLFDNVRVDGAALRLDNLETWNQGTGWAAANSVIWQCAASTIVCRSPPGAGNWAIGPWAQFVGDGRWAAVNEIVRPDSLYLAQLSDRVGAAAVRAVVEVRVAEGAARVPSVEEAVTDLASRLAAKPRAPGRPISLQNGWLVAEGKLLAGRSGTMTYWRGSTLPARAPEVGVSLTRFAPDRKGTGLTDDLVEVADGMVASGQVALRHHWGLWYDRRRDDHEMIRRPDADVWAPFYEYPWARTGQGVASNGLSRYDLTRFNPWYFGRVREFAGLARERGLVLIDEMYFQHNILEAGAHWTEFPWRPMNNVNATGFPEPPVYLESDGSKPSRPEYGKRIFVAEEFYDVSHPVRRALHRAYIRQCLANLADEPNVLHLVGEEFTGPLGFVEFWLDVIAEWSAETGRRPLLGLSATKDVQDAILADPKRGAQIAVIDLKYWWRTATGTHEPKGGANLSPRQHERLWRGGRPNAASIARMVREYHEKFPDKAVITGLAEADGWMFLAAGGSMPNLPATTDPALLTALARMRPATTAADEVAGRWVLAGPGDERFVVVAKGGAAMPSVGAAYTVRYIDLETGRVQAAPVAGRATAAWITR